MVAVRAGVAAVVSKVILAVDISVIAIPVGVVRLFRAVAMVAGVTVLVGLVVYLQLNSELLGTREL